MRIHFPLKGRGRSDGHRVRASRTVAAVYLLAFAGSVVVAVRMLLTMTS